ncbi:hypothetical protein BC829DRAFT_247308 [Chytridium lagenaria]|nr:hypothetical protein BC829DRAFT_247308 [Chytridium lagenaria]
MRWGVDVAVFCCSFLFPPFFFFLFYSRFYHGPFFPFILGRAGSPTYETETFRIFFFSFGISCQCLMYRVFFNIKWTSLGG